MRPGQPAGAVHQAALERALGRIFAAFVALSVMVFWFGSSTLRGQRPGCVAADLLLSVLLIWQAVRALRRPPSQQDLSVLAAATGSLLLASRAMAVPGSPFLSDAAYGLVTPVAVAWGAWSNRFVVPVPVLLVVLATGVWYVNGDLPVEQASSTLAIVACTSGAVRLLRAGGRRADADADALSRRMVAQDAAVAAEEAEHRAANAVHDDVLSVLRAVTVADSQVPWSLVVSKARRALEALTRQVPRGGHGRADLRSALLGVAGSVAEPDVRCDLDDDLELPRAAVETLTPAADPLAWARQMAPGPQLIFVGFMLPILVVGLTWLCLRWQDMRWQAAAAAAFLGFVGLAILCARYLSQVQMTRRAAVVLAAANTILAAVGLLAVAPGTTDPYAYWVGIDSAIVIAAVFFICGPTFGLACLALDVAVLTVGLMVTGGAVPRGVWVITLTGPPIGAGVAAAMLAAFRSLSSHTESQLAAYRERLRLQARADAISRADQAALDNARRLAGPVLDAVISSPAPDPDLRRAAALANATLRDELLAPGFLTSPLAERVRAVRATGARVTIDFAQQAEEALTETARRLLAAALADLDADSEVTLQVHPPAEGYLALLILRTRSLRSDHDSLRRHAADCGALISDLDDHELLVRLQSGPRAPEHPPQGGAP